MHQIAFRTFEIVQKGDTPSPLLTPSALWCTCISCPLPDCRKWHFSGPVKFIHTFMLKSCTGLESVVVYPKSSSLLPPFQIFLDLSSVFPGFSPIPPTEKWGKMVWIKYSKLCKYCMFTYTVCYIQIEFTALIWIKSGIYSPVADYNALPCHIPSFLQL